jgi:hypothetical protein
VSTLAELRTLLAGELDDALADVSTAQHELAEATTRRDRIEAAIVALGDVDNPADPGHVPPVAALPVVDLIGAKKAAAKPAAAPKTAPSRAGQRPGRSKYDLAQVAAIAREAIGFGVHAARLVARRLDVSQAMGGYLIAEARKKGHDIPRRGDKISGGGAVPPAAPPPEPDPVEVDAPGKSAPPPPAPVAAALETLPGGGDHWEPKVGENVVTCPDCDAIYPSVSRFRLARHIKDEHGREPTRAEMLPTTWTGAA